MTNGYNFRHAQNDPRLPARGTRQKRSHWCHHSPSFAPSRRRHGDTLHLSGYTLDPGRNRHSTDAFTCRPGGTASTEATLPVSV